MTQNDKTSSINILSTLLADVYRQFFLPPPLAPSPFLSFYMAFYFLSSCQPPSHLLSVYMESALSSLASEYWVGVGWGGGLFKSCARIIVGEMLLPTGNPKDIVVRQ